MERIQRDKFQRHEERRFFFGSVVYLAPKNFTWLGSLEIFLVLVVTVVSIRLWRLGVQEEAQGNWWSRSGVTWRILGMVSDMILLGANLEGMWWSCLIPHFAYCKPPGFLKPFWCVFFWEMPHEIVQYGESRLYNSQTFGDKVKLNRRLKFPCHPTSKVIALRLKPRNFSWTLATVGGFRFG